MLCFENVSLSAITFLIVVFVKSMNSPEPPSRVGGYIIYAGASVVIEDDFAGPAAIASSTSALIILPLGPVPTRVLRSTPLELAKF